MPSALALYSVINSGVSLIQQRLIYKKLGAVVDD
jgi:membrane protein insertase Oxa1/YidC/SpoIIIJ